MATTSKPEAHKDDIKDPFCDPDNPKVIKIDDIERAGSTIKNAIQRTPCERAERLSGVLGMDVFFKKEFHHPTGSFKERGARFTLMNLPEDQKKRGVITASCGNHALALSYHAFNLGIPVYVYMPTVAPIMKVNKCKKYAKVVIVGSDISEAMKHALKFGKSEGLLYVNGYDHPDILAGQGTIGLEICEQVPDLDAVVVPIGGAGLIAGIAVAVKNKSPKTKIIGVESDKVPSFYVARKAGKPVYIKPGATLADGLAVPKVGVNAFATANKLVDQVVVLSEDKLATAMLRLVEEEKIVVEGGAAASVAALLQDELPELKGKRVCAVLTGGNIDTTVLTRVLERGLAADNRLCKFIVVVSDRPGGIVELARLLAGEGVNIKDMYPERPFLTKDVFSVKITCVVETRDSTHSEELQEKLKATYGSENVSFSTENVISGQN